jgi:hypothetical protein
MPMINKTEICKDLREISIYILILGIVSVFFLKHIIFASMSDNITSYALSALAVSALLSFGLSLRYAWRGWLTIR